MKFCVLWSKGPANQWRFVEDEDLDATPNLKLVVGILEAKGCSDLRIYGAKQGEYPYLTLRDIPKTKGDFADLVLKGFTYDCALPQGWVDEQRMKYVDADDTFSRMEARHVWLYDGEAPVFGRPYDLFSEIPPVPLPAKQNGND